MRILLVKPFTEFSVSDVSRGIHNALADAGHDVRVYDLAKRMLYHSRAIGKEWEEDMKAVSKCASENVIVEAMYHRSDVVVIVSGLVFHPYALMLLKQGGFKTVIVHTESPYMDEEQMEWQGANPDAIAFTHDRYSAEKYGIGFLPHAYDPAIHYQRRYPTPDLECDVLMVGTGFPERIAFLEQVDWTGINLRIRGLWPNIEQSKLAPYYVEGCIPNIELPNMYAGAKICLNLHRYHPQAKSLNPRAYELAACGAFTLSDVREDGVKLFGDSVPTFSTPQELESLIRRYLSDPVGRLRCAEQARERVKDETFATRVAAIVAAVSPAAHEAALVGA